MSGRQLYTPDPEAQAKVLEALAAGHARGLREAAQGRMTFTLDDLVDLVEHVTGERTSETGRDSVRREVALWLTTRS